MNESIDETLKLAQSPPAKPEIFVLAKKPTAPICLQPLVAKLVESDRLFEFVGATVRAKRLAKDGKLAKAAKNFVTDGGLPTPLKPLLTLEIEKRVSTRTIPAAIADLIEVVETPEEIAGRLLNVLTATSGNPSEYPIERDRLLHAANCSPTSKSVVAALKTSSWTNAVWEIGSLRTSSESGGSPSSVSYLLRTDLNSILPRAVAVAIDRAVKKSVVAGAAKSVGKTTLFSAKELATLISTNKQLAIQLATDIDVLANRGIGGVGALRVKGVRHYFRVSDVEGAQVSSPSQEPAATGFADAFDSAFQRVDARTGYRNYVKVIDLRAELPQFSRSQFDAGLRELRVADRYTMEGTQGGAVRLANDELQAGIQEGSSLLVYVSRK